MGIIDQHSNDATTLKLTFSSLLLICKIFRSLNAQVRYFKSSNNIFTYGLSLTLNYENETINFYFDTGLF